jgi:LacI family transcriptional regulator
VVTLRDVAAEANVSVATVSRVLNGADGRSVRPESVVAVQDAARRLGYRTNWAARSLRLKQTETLGIVVPHITNPFFAGVVQAVEQVLEPTGWELLIGDSQDDPELESRRLQSLVQRQVEGLIVIPCEGARSVDGLQALDSVRLVQVDRRVAQFASDWVGVHHQLGIELVVGHLRQVGRSILCFVGADGDSAPAAERLRGYEQSVRRAGTAPSGRVYLGDFTLEWGMAAGQQILAERPLPDAIVCGNDLIALGVMRSLREGGVTVPSDVAVTGFDDIDFAPIVDPPLTTVRQPVKQIGALAVDTLTRRLQEPQAPWQEIRLAPTLVVRASCGATSQALK